MKRLLFAWGPIVAVAFGLGAQSQAIGARGCAVTVYPRYGTYVPSGRLHGPGLLLDGGGAQEAPNVSLKWMHERLVGTGASSSRRAGNVVVLRASYSNIYDKPFYTYGNFASVQTVLIQSCATPPQVDRVAPIVDRADAVFWAGGDQAHYVPWKGSALIAAVRRVYARGGVVGGGSAGLAIQGAVIYDSVAADRLGNDTHTADAVQDPLERRISFTTGFFAWPALANTITDSHFVVRDRFGRSVVFLARIIRQKLLPPGSVYALGIDQASSVVVGPDGIATVLNGPGGLGAYLIRADPPDPLRPRAAIRYAVSVSHVERSGERFNLLSKETGEPWYRVTVDGAKRPPYSRDPYRS